MIFDAIFLALFFLTWLLLGLLAWLALSLRRHARGALWALPFALLGGALLGAAAFRVWDEQALGARFARWATPDTASDAVASDQPTPPLDSEHPPSGAAETE